MEHPTSQGNLFPDNAPPVIYEQPLNERIRNCLRLEHLFSGIEYGVIDGSEWSTRDALGRVLEISDFLSRSDVKGDLIKELERQIAVFKTLKGNPSVNIKTLDKTLASLGQSHSALKPSHYQPSALIRADELAKLVSQRLTIPGGTCNFDVPALHFWLSGDSGSRGMLLQKWLKDLRAIETATQIILSVIRQSSTPQLAKASGGFYQEQISGENMYQIVRIIISRRVAVFPEISGGKHRFSIRFYEQLDTGSRPKQTAADIEFELHCCGV